MKVYYITEIAVIIRTLIEAVYFIVVIVSFSFIMGGFRSFIIGNFKKSIGGKAVMVMGAVGSTFHQLLHAGMAILFAHKIEDISLIKEPDKNNTLGYVKCFKKGENFYQRMGDFFIGLMPFLCGIVIMLLMMKFTIPTIFNDDIKIVCKDANSITLDFDTLNGFINSNVDLLKDFFCVSTVRNKHLYIFLLLSIYIGLSMSPDRGDIRGVSRGFCIAFIILSIFNFIDAFNLSRHTFALDIIQIGVLILYIFQILIVMLLIAACIVLILRAIVN
ncbi:membrane protein [Clostridium acetobutylicum]|nr:membrane protein [Clostridium acetobutylicum]